MERTRWMERLGGPAEVRAYGRVFTYWHMGRGTPVLLLASPVGSWRMAHELLDGLAAHFRLIVPDTAPAGTALECWLAGFLDGLGVRDVGVVADGSFQTAVSDLVSRDPGQIGQVVVVVDEAFHPAGSDTGFRPVAGLMDVPILQVTRVDLEVPSNLTPLVDFLGERAPRLPA